MKKITERFKKIMLASLGIAALDLLVGVIFLIFNGLSTNVCSVIIGALMLVHGLFYMIRYIYDGLGRKVFSVDVIFGVAAIILGIFTMLNLYDTVSFYLTMFGIGLLIIGIEQLCFVFKLKKKHEEIYPIITIISGATIIMGIVAIINPFALTILTLRLISYFLIATGLLECLFCNLFKKRTNVILDIFK